MAACSTKWSKTSSTTCSRSVRNRLTASLDGGRSNPQLSQTTVLFNFSDLVETALDVVAVPDTAGVSVDRFRDVMIADGTVLRLHELLSEEYKTRHKSRLERSSTCSTMPPRRRLNASRSRTRKPTIVACSTPGRGCKNGSYSLIWRISSTAGLH